ncbi:MAG: WYL domain-containing protein [Alphaproteobacteria bacterium]|nr:WYL domain-containing protein [Alphaproteobacteria bacterium]
MGTYGKIIDLFKLALQMQETSEGISIEEIKKEFDVSRRTAERMKTALLDSFPQMEEVDTGERTKRWRISQRSLNSLISFSPLELSVFKTAEDLLKSQGMDEKADILQIVESKLRNLLKPEQKRRVEVDAEELMKAEGLVLRPAPQIKINPEFINQIRHAILSCHQIKIKYKKKSDSHISNYQLIPYGFLYGQRDHYLVAKHSDNWDEGRAHNYSLQNIIEVEILPDVSPDDGFSLEKYAQESFGAYHEKPFDVEWLFSPKVAEEAKNYVFHPTQTITENPDGSLTVKFKAGGKWEMDWFLYTWGNEVKVIKPKSTN